MSPRGSQASATLRFPREVVPPSCVVLYSDHCKALGWLSTSGTVSDPQWLCSSSNLACSMHQHTGKLIAAHVTVTEGVLANGLFTGYCRVQDAGDQW
jgi:hypothetical protein